MSDGQQLRTEKYAIAYMDALGAKTIICSDQSNTFLNTLNAVYRRTIAHQWGISQHTESMLHGFRMEIKMFSDNIIIAAKVDNTIDSIAYLFNFVSSIQAYFINMGVLTRGGITVGDFFINDIFVYGAALVEAVVAEEKQAVFPRILVLPPAIDFFLTRGCFKAEKMHIFTQQDDDGLFYLDYYKLQQDFLELAHIKAQLKKQWKAQKNKRVLEKLEWHAKYHNAYCYTTRRIAHLIDFDDSDTHFLPEDTNYLVQTWDEMSDRHKQLDRRLSTLISKDLASKLATSTLSSNDLAEYTDIYNLKEDTINQLMKTINALPDERPFIIHRVKVRRRALFLVDSTDEI